MKTKAGIALGAALFIGLTTPVFAWYFFAAGNGQRMQWVFGSSCNTSARPISIRIDSSPGGYPAAVTAVVAQWNTPQGQAINLLSEGSTLDITAASYAAFYASPVANTIWVAHDTDGSILKFLGISSNSVLGVGLPLAMNAARPQDICSGLIVLNLNAIGSSIEYQKTLLHELGHVLGFAHNVAGGNGETIKFASISNNTITLFTPANLPIMYPFSVTGGASTLRPDDQAGAYAVYGQ